MTEQTTQRPVQPADLFQLHFLHSAALAPDGQRVAYSVASHDAGDDADYEQLWLLDLASGATRQLTFGQQRNHSPQWSPDGKTLAFISTRSGKAQIHLLPVDGGEACQLTHCPQGIGGGLAWSPDGRQLAFSAGPQPDQPHDPTLPYRLTRHIYRFDTLGYLDAAVHDLYVIEVAAEGVAREARRLTSDGCHNTAPQWSPDGRRLLYSATMQPALHKAITAELRVVTVDGKVETVIGHGWGNFSGSAAWLPDGQQIAFVGVVAGQPIGTQNDLFVVDIQSKSVVKRTTGLDRQVGARLQADMPAGVTAQLAKVVVADGGKVAYLPVQIGGTVQIYRVALTDAIAYEAVLTGERSCFLLDGSQTTGALLYAVSDFTLPLDLYLADSAGQHERRLTELNASRLAGLQSAVVESLWFPGKDGVDVEGWFIRPPGGTAPYPTILYIHGGPHSAFGAVYHFDTQMLVGAGYAVLMVNQRASTGYGNRFSTAIKGDWGNLDYTDLMAGVDAVIAKGWADPERLGVCGLSGGGNLSCWIVGQTNRFKAAVPENPVTNWQSFYGVSDIGVWFAVEQLGGHPHEIPDIYVRCSPITYAHRCKTPTLLVQGEHDWRCPAEQAEQFYTVLKANGCPVEMVRLPAMPHAGAINGTPKARRAQNEALLEWMNRYVKPS